MAVLRRTTRVANHEIVSIATRSHSNLAGFSMHLATMGSMMRSKGMTKTAKMIRATAQPPPGSTACKHNVA